ncbi:MAG: hypothetical protein JST16_12160 [Bdellovibrionales bacterium]|nr:hypothetical protein [Bdellovibrionales bacterium]
MDQNSRPVVPRTSWSWVGPCASFLCLIHCFGTGVIAALAPGLLKFLPHSPFIEGGVLAFSGSMGFLALRRNKASITLHRVFVIAAVIGAVGLALDTHILFHLALMTLGFLPLAVQIKRHYHARQKPACCDHEH